MAEGPQQRPQTVGTLNHFVSDESDESDLSDLSDLSDFVRLV
jgi:hypothetical protein